MPRPASILLFKTEVRAPTNIYFSLLDRSPHPGHHPFFPLSPQSITYSSLVNRNLRTGQHLFFPLRPQTMQLFLPPELQTTPRPSSILHSWTVIQDPVGILGIALLEIKPTPERLNSKQLELT